VVFADGFAGAYKDPGRAAFRPTGLAEGPDGALYVSDDVHGRIWRITYNGDGSDKAAPAPAPIVAATAPGLAMPPEGMHPDAGRTNPALPTPPNATADQVALGNRIFHGEASDGTCSGCHGRTPAAARSGPPSIQAIGCGATAASRDSPRRSRLAWRSPSNIRASCRPWAGRHFHRGTWRRWRPTFRPLAMPGSHEGRSYGKEGVAR
jgi:mono/diheme cytochrome c family protein